jgi:hypothetical protein
MGDGFQRLFMMAEPEILPLNAQAARGVVRVPERSQFAHLVRHFLERFFNHETASPDGDAKTRMAQIACATALPGFCVALYLFPVYHPFPGWPPGTHLVGPPDYWLQVGHHLFFIVYSFVCLGIATVFEWDMFFPDLLDVLVLGTLPIPARRMFFARVAAIVLFVAGFLVAANFIAPLVLPASTDPPNLTRFLAGHILAVFLSGLCAAVLVLALQGLLLAIFGERLVRRFSLAVQGCSIALLLMLLLLFPVFSGVVPVLLKHGSKLAYWMPPFWFLGIYQRILEGPAALPIYSDLARIGCAATLAAALVAVLTYPIAYLRKVRQLIEGPGAQPTRSGLVLPLNRLLHFTAIRPPVRRAVFHFITQTIARVPRYRIYLVLYGGVGVSIVAATILRFELVHGQLRVLVSGDGLRTAVAIVAFWTVVGLRMTIVSPGNQRGSWVFCIVHGKPAPFQTAIELLLGARVWALLVSGAATCAAIVAFHAIAPPELLTWPAVAAQALVAAGLCLLLTDVFFLNVTTIAFTGEPPQGQANLALTILKFYAFFPVVASVPVAAEPWIEESAWHFAAAAAVVALVHAAFEARHRHIVREFTSQLALEEDEEDFPMKLGLRY